MIERRRIAEQPGPFAGKKGSAPGKHSPFRHLSISALLMKSDGVDQQALEYALHLVASALRLRAP